MTDYAALIAAIDNFRDKRILCIGDVMLDRYVYGDVERISPEAPIPVLSATHEESMLGAAGNVAKNIAALGAIVEFYSAVQKDKIGFEILGLIEEEKKIISELNVSEGNRNTIKTRYVAGSQQILRVDNDGSVSEDVLRPDKCSGVDAVVLSDYCKGMIDAHTAQSIINDAVLNNIPVVVDSKALFSKYKNATVITPNLGELAFNISGFHQNGTEEEIVEAATDIRDNWYIKNILVTRASKGMTLLAEDYSVHHIPAAAKEVYDVVGAGDTVAAVLALGLAVGLSILDAAFIANIAGGIVVGKRGTAVCTPMEIKTQLLAMMETALN